MVFLLSTQSVAETEKPQKILSGKVRSAVEEGKFEANGGKLKEVDGLKKFVYNVFRFIEGGSCNAEYQIEYRPTKQL
jgi:hypothetical protein